MRSIDDTVPAWPHSGSRHGPAWHDSHPGAPVRPPAARRHDPALRPAPGGRRGPALWAVPKGPSLDPADKRLATAVADHDLAAGDFEGRHAGATRGSGAVIVWDPARTRSRAAATPPQRSTRAHLAVELARWRSFPPGAGPDARGRRGAPTPRPASGGAVWLSEVRDGSLTGADRGRDVVADEPASVPGRTPGRARRGRGRGRRPRPGAPARPASPARRPAAASGGRGRGPSARRPTGSCRRRR